MSLLFFLERMKDILNVKYLFEEDDQMIIQDEGVA